MRQDTAFRLLATLQVASGGLALTVAGSETAASGWAMIILCFLAAALGRQWPKEETTRRRVWNTLAVIALLLFIAELALTRSLLPPVVRLVVFLTTFKLFNLASQRDYFALFMLGFLQLLGAASISYDFLFALPFILFVSFSCLSLTAYTFKIGREREQMVRSLITGYPQPADSPTINWRRVPSVLVITLAVLLLTFILFPILPRIRSDVLGSARAENMQFISGFSSIVDLGDLGRIKTSSRVIMRVTVRGASARDLRGAKLRGMAFQDFDGRRWRHTMRGGRIIDRSNDGRYYLPEPPAGPALEVEIVRNPLNTANIFVLGRPERLQGPFDRVFLDRMESLFMSKRNYSQIRYDVHSTLPRRTAESLRGIRNERGQFYNFYTYLPRDSRYLTRQDLSRIRQLAASITEGSRDLFETAVRIQGHLQSNFEYTLDLDRYNSRRSKLAAFLFDYRAGHCEFFATAMVVMVRTLGIQARLVNGFQLGQYNALGGFYTVRAADAHSWVEIYFPGRGWVEFDPTPPVGQESEFARQGGDWLKDLIDSVDMFWVQNVLAYDALDQQELVQNLKRGLEDVVEYANRLTDRFLRFVPQVDPDSLAYPLLRLGIQLLAGAAVALILYFAALRPLLRRRRRKPGIQLLRVDFFEATLRLLKKKGHALLPAQTARELAAALAGESFAPVLRGIVAHYEHVRFGSEAHGDRDASEEGWKLFRRLKSAIGGERRRRS